MFYRDTEELNSAHFKRLTGVKREVSEQMPEGLNQGKSVLRKHPGRGTPPKLSNADKLLLLLMYYREYRTQFHTGITYNGRKDYLFELEDCFRMYHVYLERIDACDKKIEALMCSQNAKLGKPQTEPQALDKPKRKSKNTPKIPLEKLAWQHNDKVNLMEIKGVSYATVLAVVCEVGLSITKFPTAKQWTSWLRFSPNNRKSGGKILSSHVPKGSNRVANAMRLAAESVGKQKNAPLYP